MANSKMLLVAGFAIAIFVGGILLIVSRQSSSPDYQSARLLPSAKQLPDFSLETSSINSHPFSPADFNNHWSLVFFGFTECSDVCPLTLQQLSVLPQLALQHHLPQLQIVFVSLDPERDTPEKIKSYLAAFNPTIVGLHGNSVELGKLSHFFAVDYYRSTSSVSSSIKNSMRSDMSAATTSNEKLEHSGRIFIINPQAKYVGSFAPPHQSESLWSDLQLIIKR
jgi:protein SCO1/2